MSTYTLTVQEDPETGELVLPFTEEILKELGWKEGDTLIWKDMGNGSWSLSKKDINPVNEILS